MTEWNNTHTECTGSKRIIIRTLKM